MPDDTSDYASPTPSTASGEGTIESWKRRYSEQVERRAVDQLYTERALAAGEALKRQRDEALTLAESRRLSVVWFQGREAELIEQVNSRDALITDLRHALSVARLERDLARAQLAEVPDNAAVPVEPPALASISTRDARACKRLLQDLRAGAEGSADGSEAQLDAVIILLGLDA